MGSRGKYFSTVASINQPLHHQSNLPSLGCITAENATTRDNGRLGTRMYVCMGQMVSHRIQRFEHS